ncbi:hypothetical protein EMPS_02256 [Entomortierella parvispora]|uniref:Uncharacterized protein n=1 Tax=Entomortierella parvispora TaxID=205924 RepID=A0A9P3LTJ6_9FUNG|nr:hypothetical protein EMPS_02256 [Entomortierella parvispora]
MSKSSNNLCATSTMTTATPMQLLQIRHDSLLRKRALTTYGPQGTMDLALLGAILGNHIREIGRYKVTCDGELVHGRYSIYELVNFGVLSVTGRKVSSCSSSHSPSSSTLGSRRGSQSSLLSSTGSSSTMTTDSTTSSTFAQTTRVYPATLANLFPGLVFKALRRKAIRAPKFQHDDEDETDEPVSSSALSPVSFAFPCEDNDDSVMFLKDMDPLDNVIFGSIPPQEDNQQHPQDPLLITSEKVLAQLVQQRLHRVKDLPLPQELCFLGAVSLALPPVLRTMHVAWTMNFLNLRARTDRRQRRQQRQRQRHAPLEETTVEAGSTGGLEFRPDLYAHKMRLARLVRAQQQAKVTAASAARGSTQSASMKRGPSISIPEENEDEVEGGAGGAERAQERVAVLGALAQPERERNVDLSLSMLKSSSKRTQARNIPKPILIPNYVHPSSSSLSLASMPVARRAATSVEPASVRQDKRLMQQLLSLENKVPRAVRQWAIAARACFAEELQREDKQVQEWVDCQRIQVAVGLGCLSSSTAAKLTNAVATSSTPTKGSGRARPKLSPITTTINTSATIVPRHNMSSGRSRTNSVVLPQSRHRLSSSLPSAAAVLAASASTAASMTPPSSGLLSTIEDSKVPLCFPEGDVVYTRSSSRHSGFESGSSQQQQQPRSQGSSFLASRPASGYGVDQRLSCSQQMLSMHLWLSLLVSPLSPQQMMHDHFGAWPSVETAASGGDKSV